MAVRTRDEIMNAFRERMGEAPSDDDLALLEDVNDTLSANETLQTRYDELDRTWRKKYTDRFFEGKDPEPSEPIEPTPNKKLSYESLFKEE